MFISPKTAIEEGWIRHPNCKQISDWEDHKFLNPNAIDFTIDTLYSINPHNEFVISEVGKEMRECNEVLTSAAVDAKYNGLEFWRLDAGSCYDGTSQMYVSVPDGVAAYLVPRSTFVRNGIFLTSGLYDTGYEGNIGFVAHNRSGAARVAVGTRIGQIIFVESTSHGKYEGGYNHIDGIHWSTTSTTN